MTTIYYYRIRRYKAADEPYTEKDGQIIEDGRETVGGSSIEECVDRFRWYQNKRGESDIDSDFTYSIEIIDPLITA